MLRALKAVAVLALGLVFVRDGAAQDQRKADEGREQGSGQRQTIRGEVAGVTIVGESVIDYRTNQAVVAQVNYLTVLGRPARGQAQGGDGQGGSDARKGAGGDREKTDRDAAARGDEGQAGGQDSTERRRSNLYILALTPRTKVHERRGGEGEASRQETAPGRDDRAGSRTDLGRLEIGDRVEVRFVRTGGMGGQARGDAQKPDARKSDSQGQMDRRHGRNRIVHGDALSITILPDRPSREEGESSSGRCSGQDQGEDRLGLSPVSRSMIRKSVHTPNGEGQNLHRIGPVRQARATAVARVVEFSDGGATRVDRSRPGSPSNHESGLSVNLSGVSNMNWDQVQGNWKQFKGKVKEKWGQLTDDELDQIAGNKDQLVGKLQEKYGYAREQAEREVEQAAGSW